jgi:large subunit ribosomal protein L6
MSRIGKNPVSLPVGVEVFLAEKEVKFKGKLGELQMVLSPEVHISVADNLVTLEPVDQSKRARQMWGLLRSNVSNMVQGVSEGFTKKLEIQGVGYRAAMQGKKLKLELGYSHSVLYDIPEGITVTCEKPTDISVKGRDKQTVGQAAAEIRSFRKPEPYKGKGIRYVGEYVRRKEGKKK